MNDRLGYATRLIHGAWKQQKAITVYAPQPALADGLDQLLWAQPALSFVPHCFGDSPLAAETPVLIARNASELAQSCQHERLLNLSDELPPGFECYTSLVEVVSQDETTRLSGRERVLRYREQGLTVHFENKGNEHAG